MLSLTNSRPAVNKGFYYKLFFILILLALLYTPYFSHLGTLPVRVWDEARRGVIAYEMSHSDNPIVTTYEGRPDYVTTKPPLLIWFQALFIKMIGMNELAVRLPVAIMALITSLILFSFIKRFTGKYWLGWISALLLATVQGYVSMHGSRSGDYDVPVTFFIVLYSFSYMYFLEKEKPQYLYLTYIFIALAVMTKGVIGFTFLPALLIYTLVKGKFLTVLRNKHFYYGIPIVVVIVSGYYGLREYFTPGYLEAVARNELGGRYLDAKESHIEGFWFYFKQLNSWYFSYWILFIIPGVFFGFTQKNRWTRDLNMFCSIAVIVYFLVISTAQTKLEWYAIPMFPFLAIIVGTAVYFVFQYLQSKKISESLPVKTNLLSYIWLLLVFVTPYSEIVDKTFFPKDKGTAYEYYKPEYFLKSWAGKGFNPDGYTIVKEGYWQRFLFYVYQLRDQGYTIHVADEEELKPGDKVISLMDGSERYIKKHYQCEKIGGWYGIKWFKIESENFTSQLSEN